MFKGHLKIELKDEKTGKVEKHEQDNMVTNALAYVLGLAAQDSTSAANASHIYNVLPAATKALGGIFLFDGTLEESVENIHFPMNVHLIGHAGQAADTASRLGGSINTVESGKTDTGYVNVWDFSTSQANGTIASLALTYYLAGQNPFTNFQSSISYYSLSHTYYGVGYDEDTSTEYLYQYSEGEIYKKKIYNAVITATSPSFGEEEEVFDFAFSNPNYSNWHVMNGYDGYIYAINFASLTTAGTVSIRIRKVKVEKGTFTEEDEQDFTINNITTVGTMQTFRAVNYTLKMITCVSCGYLYLVSQDHKTLYKVNLSNTADISEYTFDEATIQRMFPKRGGGIIAVFGWTGTTSSGSTATYYSVGYVYPDGKYCYQEESTRSVNEMQGIFGYETDKLLFQYTSNSNSYREYYSFATNYLGTICNLDSPVVKTSAQSMKITYTLTDVSNEGSDASA